MAKTKTINVPVKEDLKEWLAKTAAKRQTSMAAVARQILLEAMEKSI